MEPPNDPNHPLNRFPWQHPRSRERTAIESFLLLAHSHVEWPKGPLPFTAAEGQRVLDWLDELVKQPSPLSRPR